MLTKVSNANINFLGYKDDLRLGNSVLKEIKKDYGYLHSNTYVDMKIAQIHQKPIYKELAAKLLKLSDCYNNDVTLLRNQYDSFFNKNKKMKAGISYFKAANCSELSSLVFSRLLKEGQKPHMVGFDFYDAHTGWMLPNKDHCFTVFGLKKGAKVVKPETWGSKAIIVDPWLKISGNAHDCIEYMKMQMKFDESKHFIRFSNETTISQRLTSLISRLK